MSHTDHARRPVDKRRNQVLSILREQRVRIVSAVTFDGASVPNIVIARVRGHLGVYAVDFRDDQWCCTCREGSAGTCAHSWAVRFVTGHGGAG